MATRTMLHDLIGQEVAAGIAPGRVLIGGFSQGAAMACFAALTFDQPLAGCFLLSGYLTLKGKVPGMVTAGAKQTPFWQAHGSQDPVVPFLFGQVSSHAIQQLGVAVEFKQYTIAHTADPSELADLKAFMLRVLHPPSGALRAAAQRPRPGPCTGYRASLAVRSNGRAAGCTRGAT